MKRKLASLALAVVVTLSGLAVWQPAKALAATEKNFIDVNVSVNEPSPGTVPQPVVVGNNGYFDSIKEVWHVNNNGKYEELKGVFESGKEYRLTLLMDLPPEENDKLDSIKVTINGEPVEKIIFPPGFTVTKTFKIPAEGSEMGELPKDPEDGGKTDEKEDSPILKKKKEEAISWINGAKYLSDERKEEYRIRIGAYIVEGLVDSTLEDAKKENEKNSEKSLMNKKIEATEVVDKSEYLSSQRKEALKKEIQDAADHDAVGKILAKALVEIAENKDKAEKEKSGEDKEPQKGEVNFSIKKISDKIENISEGLAKIIKGLDYQIYDIEAFEGKTKVTNLNEKKAIELSLEGVDLSKVKNISVYHINPDKSFDKVDDVKLVDGKLVFNYDRFSPFVIAFEKAEAEKRITIPNTGNKPMAAPKAEAPKQQVTKSNTPNTGDSADKAMYVTLMLVSGGLLALVSSRRKKA
ncbi:MAG: hypothetical protein SPI74_01650 [Eubacterium sp.]|nr:hypothetical protein [Eubacterium sp.]